MMEDRLLFIVGVGRSGTSLLQSMIGAHPDVAVAPETHFLRDYLLDRRRYDRYARMTPVEFRAVLADSEPFSRAGIDPADVVPTDAPLDVKHCYQRLAAQFAQQRNGSWFGDKDPNLIDYLPALATAFPRARVIHIYRDPRDVVLSKTKAAWSAGRPYWQHALIGELQLRRGREAAREYFRGRYAELAYEDLLADPEATLRGMCEEVGLPYDPAMLAYTDTARELVADSERSWKKETFRPIQKNNVRKWEGNLTDDQVGLIEHLSTTCFEELGYRRSGNTVSLAGRLLGLGVPLARPLYGLLRKNKLK